MYETEAGIRTQGPSNLPQLTMEKGIVDFLFLHQNNKSGPQPEKMVTCKTTISLNAKVYCVQECMTRLNYLRSDNNNHVK